MTPVQNPVSRRAATTAHTVVRATAALVVAIAVTFSQNHSATFGLFAAGALALAWGIGDLALGPRTDDARLGLLPATVTAGAAGAVLGTAALLAAVVAPPTAAPLVLVLVLVVWAVLVGSVDALRGFRQRGRSVLARDTLTLAAFALVLAVAVVLTAGNPLVVVGVLGAYGALVGVFLFIAALSFRWATDDKAVA